MNKEPKKSSFDKLLESSYMQSEELVDKAKNLLNAEPTEDEILAAHNKKVMERVKERMKAELNAQEQEELNKQKALKALKEEGDIDAFIDDLKVKLISSNKDMKAVVEMENEILIKLQDMAHAAARLDVVLKNIRLLKSKVGDLNTLSDKLSYIKEGLEKGGSMEEKLIELGQEYKEQCALKVEKIDIVKAIEEDSVPKSIEEAYLGADSDSVLKKLRDMTVTTTEEKQTND